MSEAGLRVTALILVIVINIAINILTIHILAKFGHG